MAWATPFAGARRPPWKLALTGAIPLDLSVNQAAGEQRLDLTGLNLSRLDSFTAVGQNLVILPEGDDFSGKAGVAVGELIVRVPRGAAVEIVLDTAIAGVNYPPDFTREDKLLTSPGAKDAASRIRLTVNVPIGNLRVEYLP